MHALGRFTSKLRTALKMNVLLTNDDGIYAPGLWVLFDKLKSAHRVTVIAPDRERSAVSHAITLHQPLRAVLTSVNGSLQGYAVNGTPADCVKLGISEILEVMPDFVISGINPGANVGVNINYSGTVAAAKEAALNGIKAIAVSTRNREGRYDDDAADFVLRLMDKMAQNKLPEKTFLNVNMPDVPADEASGIQVGPQNLELFRDQFEKRTDPRERTYYWQGCDPLNISPPGDVYTDSVILSHKGISITPIKCDMTDYQTLEAIKSWDLTYNCGSDAHNPSGQR